MNHYDDARSDQDDDFVKDIEEESNEEDDFENKMEETIAAHHKLKDRDVPIARPESGNRPQTASRNRIESAKMGGQSNGRDNQDRKNESAQTNYERTLGRTMLNKDAFYERFNEYVGSNHINPEDMWQMNKDRLNYDEFKRCLESIGFKYSKEELEDVMFDISDAEFYVTLDSFCKKIEAWRSGRRTDDALEQIRENAMRLVSDTKRKFNQDKKAKNILIRPFSSSAGANRPFSGISAISSKSKQNFPTQNNQTQNMTAQNRYDSANNTANDSQYPRNKSAYYLKKAKEKEAKLDQILALTINKGKNEYEYECLMKMGEANELSQALGSKVTYRAFRSSDGSLKCNVFEYDKFKKEITMKELHREFNHLKHQYIQQQDLKIWDVLTANKKGGPLSSRPATSTISRLEKASEGEESKPKQVNKKERQNELKQVLFETMKLTNTLKNQLKKLEMSGLTYSNFTQTN